MKKRTIRIDGIKLGYKHGFDLYELIKDQTNIQKKTTNGAYNNENSKFVV